MTFVYATSVLNTSYKKFAMHVQKRLIEDGMIRIMKLIDAGRKECLRETMRVRGRQGPAKVA
jgi:hypothetical protein